MSEIELREHLESLIVHERELREANERAAAAALSHQADEYARRLKDLNGEADRLRVMQDSYVPAGECLLREVGRERTRAELGAWQRNVDRQLDAYRGALAAMAVGLTILSLILRFLPIGP